MLKLKVRKGKKAVFFGNKRISKWYNSLEEYKLIQNLDTVFILGDEEVVIKPICFPEVNRAEARNFYRILVNLFQK